MEDLETHAWGFISLNGFPVVRSGCVSADDLEQAQSAATTFLDTLAKADPARELLTTQLAGLPAAQLAEYWKTYRASLQLASPPRVLATLPAGALPGSPVPGRYAVVRYALDSEAVRQNLELWLASGEDGRWRVALVPAPVPAIGP